MAISSKTKRTQLGREAVAGTGVPATQIWTGQTAMTDGRTVEMVPEMIGDYMGRGTSYIASLGDQTLTQSSHPCNFEEILHVLEAGIMAATPTGADPYVYEYILPAGSSDSAIKTYTLETGDGNQAYEGVYGFVESFTLTGAAHGVLMLTANWRVQEWNSTTFTAALSPPTGIEVIKFFEGSLYIDDSGGTVGTTQVSNSFKEFSLEVNCGIVPVYTGEGEMYFSTHKRHEPGFTLSITAEHDATWNAAGEVADWKAEAIRQLRIQFDGTTSRQLVIDMAGKWETFEWGDADGNSIISGSMVGINSATDTLGLTMEVTNGLATVP